MIRSCLALVFCSLLGCSQSYVPVDAAVADAAPDDDAGCTTWARPTGTCTGPGVCCVSSVCVSGICR